MSSGDPLQDNRGLHALTPAEVALLLEGLGNLRQSRVDALTTYNAARIPNIYVINDLATPDHFDIPMLERLIMRLHAQHATQDIPPDEALLEYRDYSR